MEKITAQNIVSFIAQLSKDRTYNYLNPRNHGLIQIVDVVLPEGPIRIKRWNPTAGDTPENSNVDSISSQLIWRIANAFRPGQPINFDRLLGGSYNTRSVLEALLAYTPQFYFCYPGRIESINSRNTIKRGHKHLAWIPSNPHELGIVKEYETDIVISEIPTIEAFYEALVLPDDGSSVTALDIDIKRRHAQIQIALYFIGLQLGFRTWIAQNDLGITYQDKKLIEYEGVIKSLKEEKLMKSHDEAIRAALLIDCIWFKNGRLMPAVMEVEHSTGVTSGLTRMKGFQDKFPPFPTRYVIVAPDEDRDKVIRECNREQFASLDAKFFPYSAVEELYALCQRRKIKGVTEEFLDCYMEPVRVIPSYLN